MSHRPAIGNSKSRWSFTEWMFWGQHLRPILAPFVDMGRVHDGIDLRFDDWRSGGGVAFRLVWNVVTAVSFDFGASREESVFYMELGQQY